jgi:hypothetical protein
MPGLPVVGADGALYVLVRDVSADLMPALELRVDGEAVTESMMTQRRAGEKAGQLLVHLFLPESLPRVSTPWRYSTDPAVARHWRVLRS